jgi:hypothetical protein
VTRPSGEIKAGVTVTNRVKKTPSTFTPFWPPIRSTVTNTPAIAPRTAPTSGWLAAEAIPRHRLHCRKSH